MKNMPSYFKLLHESFNDRRKEVYITATNRSKETIGCTLRTKALLENVGGLEIETDKRTMMLFVAICPSASLNLCVVLVQWVGTFLWISIMTL